MLVQEKQKRSEFLPCPYNQYPHNFYPLVPSDPVLPRTGALVTLGIPFFGLECFPWTPTRSLRHCHLTTKFTVSPLALPAWISWASRFPNMEHKAFLVVVYVINLLIYWFLLVSPASPSHPRTPVILSYLQISEFGLSTFSHRTWKHFSLYLNTFLHSSLVVWVCPYLEINLDITSSRKLVCAFPRHPGLTPQSFY